MYNTDENERMLEILMPKDLRQGFVNNAKESLQFKFQKIFDQDSSQEEVFELVALPVVLKYVILKILNDYSCMDGYNGTIFAYGQTGSGKTFSMSGGDSWELRGIIPRVFSQVFQEIRNRQDFIVYNVYCSYFEIYNECGFDLLDRKHAELPFEKWNKINLYEDNNANLHLRNLSIHKCFNEQDSIDLLMMGNFIRQVSSTSMNQASSRSHCIFTIALEGRDLETDIIRTSKLHLVDLAGSERVYKHEHDKQIKTEAKYINRSLTYLEQVIIALHDKAKGTRVHIPYRNSMMTSVLRDSLGGNCKTVMIANLSPDIENEEETISTCRFAQRCAMLVNEIRINEIFDINIAVQKLEAENLLHKETIQKQEEIIKQQNQLLMMAQQSNPHFKPMTQRSSSDTPQRTHSEGISMTIDSANESVNQLKFLERELSDEEIEFCEIAAKEYVRNDSYEIEIHNLNEVNEYFRIFKDEIIKKEQKNQKEITDLKMQINLLKAKLEGSSYLQRIRFSTDDVTQKLADSMNLPSKPYFYRQGQSELRIFEDNSNSDIPQSDANIEPVDPELEKKVTQLINQKATLINPPNQTQGKLHKEFGNCSNIGTILGPSLFYIQSLQDRDEKEKEVYQTIIQDYQKLMQECQSIKDELQDANKKLMLQFYDNKGVDVNDKENKGLKKLKNELQDLYKKNAQYSTDILDLTKRNTQLEGQIYKLSEELAQQKSFEYQKRCDEAENALKIFNSKYTVMVQEHTAMKETNKFLENKVNTLTAENNNFVKYIMELKDTQIEKFNQANDLIKELNDMKSQLQKYKTLKSTTDLVISPFQEEMKHNDIETSQTPKFERAQTLALPKVSILNDYDFGSIECVPSHVVQKYHAHKKEATCLAFNLSGNYLATGGGDSLIKIWDVQKNVEHQTIRCFNKAISCIAFSYDSEYIMGCCVDKSIKFCRLRHNQVACTLSGHQDTINACVCAYTQFIGISASSDRSLRMWDYTKCIQVANMMCTSSAYSVDVSFSDSTIASGHRDGTLRLWSMRDHKLIKEIKNLHDEVITGVTFTADGQKILTNSKDNTLKLIDVKNQSEIRMLEDENYFNGSDTNTACTSVNGRYAAVGSNNGNLVIFDLNNGEIEEIFEKQHTTNIVSCAWQKRGGSKVATIDNIGNLFIWN